MTTEVYTIENFFTEEECDWILENYTKVFRYSGSQGQGTLGEYIPGYRSAKFDWIRDNFDDLIIKYREKLRDLTGASVDNFECPHVVEYKIGCQYKRHFDFFPPNTDYYEKVTKQGGQRTHSCILYLNENFTGGETKFYQLNKKVKPQKGLLCYWRNIDVDGNMNYDTEHAGLPVTSGTKYVLITWIRENEFKMETL